MKQDKLHKFAEARSKNYAMSIDVEEGKFDYNYSEYIRDNENINAIISYAFEPKNKEAKGDEHYFPVLAKLFELYEIQDGKLRIGKILDVILNQKIVK